jgi:predicted ABC-type ATPase
VRRFRLFAGPNGSGKSTLYDYLKGKRTIHTGLYVSADRIESDIRRNGKFVFNAYRIKVSEPEFQARLEASGLISARMKRDYAKSLSIQSGQLIVPKSKANSYLASVIAAYLVHKLFQSKQSFCFETVMSHESKIDILRKAQANGYRTYLYFVFTADPKLNQLRVKHRTQLGGHSVPPEKIEQRYYRSMKLLSRALSATNRAYLIDNSREFETVAIKDQGKLVWRVDLKDTALSPYIGQRH